MSTFAPDHCAREETHKGRRTTIRRLCLLILCGGVGAWIGGCAKPNPVTIQLRKDKQELESQIAQLQQQNAAYEARIAGLEQERGTVPTLPQGRLEQMFTVHEIKLGRLTGGTDLDPKQPGDEGLRIYLEPVDQSGDVIKATGHVTVEAFDLSKETENRIGRWEFTPEELKKAWRALVALHDFVLVLPWQTVPQRPEIAIRVTFRDALTGRTLTALKDVKITPPPTTQPTAQP